MLDRKHTKVLLRAARRLDQRLHRYFSGRSDSAAHPLLGDRCIEYAFVVRELVPLDRNKAILDVGCCGSPLTSVLSALGFETVHGIDLKTSPVEFSGVKFLSGDFLTTTELSPHYDIVVFCSSIEHFGMAGRYGSKGSSDADLQALRKAIGLLPAGGTLILTLPYGVERVIAPWHRVYNKESELLREAKAKLQLKTEVFFARRNPLTPWAACSEAEAARVVPSADSYALGMFNFTRP